MKIQIASDLHLEHVNREFPKEPVIRPVPDADLLILAGDIASGIQAVNAFMDWPVPVLYVPGNHEAYGYQLKELVPALRAVAKDSPVIVLEEEVADFRRFPAWHAKHAQALSKLRFLGTTLWTDYRLPGLNRTQRQQMDVAQLNLADHRYIGWGDRSFTPSDALTIHEKSVEWLNRELSKPFDGTTVVITHHGPSKQSTHPRWAGNSMNGAFMSHLPELLEKANLWVHGHVHDSCDYVEQGCRVVANPRGYALNLGRARKLSDVQWENQAFNAELTVEF